MTGQGLIIVALVFVSLGGLVVFSLAFARVLPGWGIFFFYTAPALAILAWTWHEASSSTWRRATWPFVKAWYAIFGRGRRRGTTSAAFRSDAPASPALHLEPITHARASELSPGSVAAFVEGTIERWLVVMRPFLAAWRSPRGRRIVGVVFGAAAIGTFALVARHFASLGWPLERADPGLAAIAGSLFLCSYALKASGWRRLFRPSERPRSLTLAAASGAATVTGAALPGRFDDVVRVAVIRRFTGPLPRLGTVVLTLFLLALLDTTALTPFAFGAALTSSATLAIRIALAVVGVAGIFAASVVAGLPRVAASQRLGRYRLGRWLGQHAPASSRDAWHASFLVMGSWLIRAIGIVALLAALGFGRSFPLAIAFLAAGAAAAALPIGPAGAATQAGAGAAVFIASGIATERAVAFAVVAQTLSILAGAVVVLLMVSVRCRQRLRERRASRASA